MHGCNLEEMFYAFSYNNTESLKRIEAQRKIFKETLSNSEAYKA